MNRLRSKPLSPSFCGTGVDPEGFLLWNISETIGYGIVTTKNFQMKDYLLEYIGERISKEEAFKRESIYKEEGIGCYLFDVDGINKKICIDATKDTHHLCRYAH
ncbi:N-lysine methyltransferase KMT5A-like [Clytia hemisphaerica]|uniref:N-lysine methyltransferase KMT5A-like n=1 Tax=Clytia hemisphaerica TaxID=252671 RepID=UPI0034D7956E